MRIKSPVLRLLICGSLSLSYIVDAAAASIPQQWRASTAVVFASGDYGTDSTTTSTYIPFGLDRLFSRGRLGLVIPLVSVTTEEAVTLVDGVPRNRGNRPRGRLVNESHTESGLGDIVLRGKWYAQEESERRPNLALIARIKFPTADEDEGLGTGEFDETLGVEVSKDIVDSWFLLGDAGYTFIGSPDRDPLRDSFYFGFGGGHYFPHDLTGTAELAWRRALRSQDDDPTELIFGVQYTGITRTSLGTSLALGLTDGAPDVTFGLSAALRF